jgi:hypothetical protein
VILKVMTLHTAVSNIYCHAPCMQGSRFGGAKGRRPRSTSEDGSESRFMFKMVAFVLCNSRQKICQVVLEEELQYAKLDAATSQG